MQVRWWLIPLFLVFLLPQLMMLSVQDVAWWQVFVLVCSSVGLSLGLLIGLNWVVLRRDRLRSPSVAVSPDWNSPLGECCQAQRSDDARLSGVKLMDSAQPALSIRFALANLAQHSIDAQYYIWEGDRSGRVLLHALLAAADRGVRVRLLLDDYTLSKGDPYLAAFNAHPYMEIRLFNPFSHRFIKSLGFLTDAGRLNHRMHNKLFVVDNMMGIVGGRNIADYYFGLSDHHNFRDLDVLLTGPGVEEVSHSFDLFWNSRWSFKVSALYRRPISTRRALEYHAALRQEASHDLGQIPFDLPSGETTQIAFVNELLASMVWAPVTVVYDLPEKVVDGSVSIAARVEKLWDTVQHELLAEVAYFIPGKSGLRSIAALLERGVDVTIVTNSLASNDVPPVHSGYMVYRQRLLRLGVGLYEYRPNAKDRASWTELAQKSESRLHTKTYLIDRRFTVIGSINADPRSRWLNTEVGLMIDSEAFAQEVRSFLQMGVKPNYSYRLLLDEQSQQVRWALGDKLLPAHVSDPHATLWEKIKMRLLRLLPIEEQL